MKIYERIKQRRKEIGLSAEQVAEKLNVSPATIYRYEKNDIKKFPTEILEPLAKVLNTTPAYLMGWEDIARDNPITDEEYGKMVRAAIKSKKIPVLGKVIAGIPIDAVEEILDYEEISEEMSRQGEFFALQIKGDSMEPKFSEGDVVIVRKQEDVDNGDIAIVLVNGYEATVKKIKKFEGGINLIPTNSSYDVMTYTNEQIEKLPVQIVGKVVELRAKF